MWYKFSKLRWVWDITDGIEYTYAYVNADNKEKAIIKVNSCSNIRRRYIKMMTGIVSICIILACTFILMCVAFLMLRNEMMDSDDDGDEKTY